MTRCPWAIQMVTLTTRCSREAGHGVDLPDSPLLHEAKGLAEYPYQRIEWLPGDRREFTSDRADEHAWDETPRQREAKPFA